MNYKQAMVAIKPQFLEYHRKATMLQMAFIALAGVSLLPLAFGWVGRTEGVGIIAFYAVIPLIAARPFNINFMRAWICGSLYQSEPKMFAEAPGAMATAATYAGLTITAATVWACFPFSMSSFGADEIRHGINSTLLVDSGQIQVYAGMTYVLVAELGLLATACRIVWRAKRGKLTNPEDIFTESQKGHKDQTIGGTAMDSEDDGFYVDEPESAFFRVMLEKVNRVDTKPQTAQVEPIEETDNIKIGGVSIAVKDEPKHFMLSGSVGAGKSTAIIGLLKTIRARGQRAVIYDKTGDFVSRFYREGTDVIINHFDGRGVDWTPLVDFTSEADFATFAQNLLPDSKSNSDSGQFFTNAGRALIESAMLAARGSLTKFMYLLVAGPIEDLKQAVIDAGKQGMIGKPDTFAEVRSTAAIAAAQMKHIRTGNGDDVFSIKAFIMDESHDGWIFVTSSAEHQSALRPTISAALDIATNAAMRLPPNEDRRLWMVLDELPTLNKLKALNPILAEARKYGVCAVLGFQSIGQMNDIYGRDLSAALIGQPSTRLILRVQDGETSEHFSREIGDKKVERTQVSTSVSPGQNGSSSTSTSTSKQIVVERAVLASTIQALPDLTGYLRTPGQAIKRVTVKRYDLPMVAEAFVRYVPPDAPPAPPTEPERDQRIEDMVDAALHEIDAESAVLTHGDIE